MPGTKPQGARAHWDCVAEIALVCTAAPPASPTADMGHGPASSPTLASMLSPRYRPSAAQTANSTRYLQGLTFAGRTTIDEEGHIRTREGDARCCPDT